MTEDELRRVIEPFQQADTSTARRFGGTGLGLSICRELIHLLGGVFMYASAPGRGTIFLFAIPCTVMQQQDAGGAGAAPLLGPAPLRPATLAPPAAHVTGRRSEPSTPRTSASPPDATSNDAPAAPGAATAGPAAPAALTAATSPAAPAPRQEAAAASLRGRVVMVADDNPVNIQVVRRQLDELGCKCIAASNGEECVELVRQALLPGQSKAVPRPDVILMDINMPVMDGVQATAAIRALEQELAVADEGAGEGEGGAPHRPVLIVGLSADDPADLQRSHEGTLSLDTFLRKPVTLADLRQCLESLLAPPAPADAGP